MALVSCAYGRFYSDKSIMGCMKKWFIKCNGRVIFDGDLLDFWSQERLRPTFFSKDNFPQQFGFFVKKRRDPWYEPDNDWINSNILAEIKLGCKA